MSDRVRWWKNGDAPGDDLAVTLSPEGAQVVSDGKTVGRYKPRSKTPTDIDPLCGQAWEVHGTLHGTIVHPGDYLVVEDGDVTGVERPDNPTEVAAAQIEQDQAEQDAAKDDASDVEAPAANPGPPEE